MNYCIAAADRFTSVADPFKNDRVCFKFKILEKLDMVRIAEDPNFIVIHNNVVYFKKP